MLAVRSTEGREVEVWHLACPDRPWRVTTPAPVGGLAWDPTGTELAIGSGNDVVLWKLGRSTPRAILTGHFSRVNGLAYAPDGGAVASSGYDAIVRFWDPRSGRPLARIPGVLGPWFDRGGGRVAFANGSRLVVVRTDPPDGVRTLYRDGSGGIGTLDIDPGGRLVAASGNDGVTVWDLGSGGAVAHLPVGATAAAAFDPSGTSLVTFGRSPGRWPIARGTTLRFGPPDRLPSPGGLLVDPSQSADGRTVVAGVGAEVLVLDAAALSVRRRLAAPLNHWRPAVSPDGQWVAVGCWHGTEVRVWEAATGELLYRRHFPTTSACRVGFSPDGRWLVEGTGDEYRTIETGTWRPAWTVPRENAGDLPGVMAFSRDGSLLAVAHSPVLVKLYRTETAEEVATFPSPDPHLLGGLCFSRDGGRLVASTEGDRLFAWDLRAIRAGLTRFGLDWDLPPLPPVDDPRPVLVEVEPGDLHPGRREAAECRRVLSAKPDDPSACNNLAWQLATGPDDLRDAAAALPLAEKAVRLSPTPARLNTLGVVLYRLGRWEEAVTTLKRAGAASGGEATAFDAFFLAMCYHRLGEPAKARQEFARAVRWTDLHLPDDGDELTRFRVEAEALIGQ
jgi:WD40 repeat protein